MPMKTPVHPGTIVKSSLEELGLSVTAAAMVREIPRPTISKGVGARTCNPVEKAIRLSKAFGSTPEFWLRLQLNFDLAQVRAEADNIHVERYLPAAAA